MPEKINFNDFVSDPDKCIPLKNMFMLAGYDEIGKILVEEKQRINGLRNVFRRVGQITTDHMAKVWPEWRKQKVHLAISGDFIETGIEDEFNIYSLERRSDCFKRFFTFLLMISAQNKTESLSDNLIVFDKPDICLHPSGIQYLRDELKKIGKNNKVIVSTHSIFMIDKEVIDRHLIVNKFNEITNIERAGGGDIIDEEVIMRALGFSIYELLKQKNIIFEGWRDKKMFDIYMRSKRGAEILGKKDFHAIGLLHAMGVKDISRVSNICENVNRNYVIISDSDRPAKERQKNFTGSGKWLCYDDIEGVDILTTEDFVSNELVNKALRKIFSANSIDIDINLSDANKRDKLKYIENELSAKDIEQGIIKRLLNEIKGFIFDDLKTGDIRADYADVAKAIVHNLRND